MKRLYVITQQLEHGMPLYRGPGYLSNGHWLMRWSAAAQPILAPLKPSKLTIARLLRSASGKKLRRIRVRRTGERYRWPQSPKPDGDLHASRCYASPSGRLEVWLSTYYLEALGLSDTLYAIDAHTAVTDRAKGWRVALMPMRAPLKGERSRKRGRRC